MKEIKLIDITEISQVPRTQLTVDDVVETGRDSYHRYGMNFSKDLRLQGKYCYHPFNTVTIDSNGDCFVCVCQAWLPISVGNILDFNSLTEIVQSPKAREIQASILDGSYKYCDHNTCHLIKSNNLENKLDHRPDTVNWIVFAIDDSCNLSCPSCRTGMIFHKDGPEFEKRMAISRHVTKLIQNHHHFLKFTLSGDGDPFASHVYRNILENLHLRPSDQIEIEIVTNGILIASHWDRMSGIHKHVKRFKISFDAGTPETYALTRRQGDWDKLIENCKYIIKWKQKNYSDMEIIANFVVQNNNYKDIHEYIRITTELGFDEIAFQKVTDWGKWWDGPINRFFEHAIWMEEHSNHKELVQILSHPLVHNRRIQLTNLSPLVNNNNVPRLEHLVVLKTRLADEDRFNYPKFTIAQTSNYIKDIHPTKKFSKNIEKMYSDYIDLSNRMSEIDQYRKDLISSIDQEIYKLTEAYLVRGYVIDGFVACSRTDVEGERHRKLNMSDESKQLIIAQVGKYTNWKYAALEIGPGEGEWTEYLVANEPLYLVDTKEEFLEEAKKRFNDHYQNKIRTYKTSETDLSMLPQNQFGFVFSWNVFNYLTLDLIEEYLESIWKVLTPGGVAMFSYNNAERVLSARFVDTGYMTYAPKQSILYLIEKYQFELIATQDIEEHVSWVEIRKPGELSSIKVHPAIGVVLTK